VRLTVVNAQISARAERLRRRRCGWRRARRYSAPTSLTIPKRHDDEDVPISTAARLCHPWIGCGLGWAGPAVQGREEGRAEWRQVSMTSAVVCINGSPGRVRVDSGTKVPLSGLTLNDCT